MPQAKKPPKVMIDKMNAVVDAIGDLMGCYPEDGDIQEELRGSRQEITGLVMGDLTDTLDQRDSAIRDGYREVKKSVTESRLTRARRRLQNEDKLVELLEDHELMQEFLNKA